MADGKPIIIVKKKGGHGGHHGGAWKVAYADFVTAMMAFFMVMWLVNSADTVTKQNIAQYFKKPGIFQQGSGTPLLIGQSGILSDAFVPAKKVQKGARGGDTKVENPDEFRGLGVGKEQKDMHRSGGKTGPIDSEKPGSDVKDGGLSGDSKFKVLKKTVVPALEVTPPSDSKDPKDKKSEDAAVAAIAMSGADGQESGQGKSEGEAQGGPTEGEKQGGPTSDSSTGVSSMNLGLGDGGAGAAQAELEILENAAKEIKEMISGSPDLQKLLGIVDVKIDADGLNIEIIDTEKSSMFALGQAAMLPEARIAFAKIAELVTPIPNKIEIVGHTDAKPFGANSRNYTNWELSTDRAHAARRILEDSGVPADRVTSVMGRADKQLKNKEDAFDPINRRISLKMRFRNRANVIKFTGQQLIETQDVITGQSKLLPAEEKEIVVPGAAGTQSETVNAKQFQQDLKANKLEALPEPSATPDGGLIWTPRKIIQAAESLEASKRQTIEDTVDSESIDAGSGGTNPAQDKLLGASPVITNPDIFGQ